MHRPRLHPQTCSDPSSAATTQPAVAPHLSTLRSSSRRRRRRREKRRRGRIEEEEEIDDGWSGGKEESGEEGEVGKMAGCKEVKRIKGRRCTEGGRR